MASVYDDLLEARESEDVAPKTGSVYDSILDEKAKAQSERTGIVLDSVLRPTTDREARVVELAKSTRLPADVIERNFERVDRSDRARKIQDAMMFSPVLRAQMESPQFAAIAHDDTETLAGIERAIHNIKEVAKYVTSYPGQDHTLLSDLGAGVYQASSGLAGLGQAGFETLGAVIDPAVGRLLPANPALEVSNFFKSIGDDADAISERLSPRVPGRSSTSAAVSVGMQSLAHNLVLLPTFLVSPQTYLSLMSASVGGGAFRQAREQGIGLGPSLSYGASQALIEFATEKLPLHILLKDIKVGTGLMKTIARQTAVEIPREQLAEFLQDLNEWAVLPENKKKTADDFMAERPEAAYQTLIATIIGSVGQTTVMHGAYHVLASAEQKERNAIAAMERAKAIEDLNRMVAASRLAKRSPEDMQQFVEQAAADGAEHVYVEADALMQSGLADGLAQVSPSVAEQIAGAAQTGGMVSIPMEEYVSRIAPTDIAPQLVDHLKFDPEWLSRAEARDASTQQEELRAEFDRVVAQQESDERFRESADTVHDAIKEQLEQAGRFTSDVNDAYATLVSQWYAIQSARLGMMPSDLYSRFQLRVQAQAVTDDQTYGQDGRIETETEAFRAWFGDSKVVDAEGKPLVVYHGGTVEDTFDAAHSGSGSGREGGFFFTPDIRQARDYAGSGSVKDVYLSIKNPLYTDHQLEPEEVAKAKADGYDGYWLIEDGLVEESEIVAFEPTQIKSVHNRGTFDANDPNILRQGAQAPRGTFSPGTLTISLLKHADLSTFLHETGHFFLEAHFDMAIRLEAQAGAEGMESLTAGEQEIIADAHDLLAWFGVRDLHEWYGLDFEVRREHHEQFARGFEAYLFEGKSPSIELHGLFQRFRAWLVNVYKELKNLNVELSDEVRAVFDRMLASSEQIELAEQAGSMMPLFETAEQAGMKPDEFAAYQSMAAQATADAIERLQERGLRDMRWLQNARSRAIKELQKQADARRTEIRIEARREVMSQPIYRAWQFLTSKVGKEDRAKRPKLSFTPDVDPATDSLFVAIAKLGGLDKAEVKSQWGVDSREVGRPVFGKPVIRVKGGRYLDDIRQALIELGYLAEEDMSRDWDGREFEDKFDEELRGNTQYSSFYDPSLSDDLRSGDHLVNPAALSAGRLDVTELQIDGHPEEVIGALKARGMTGKSGLHAGLVADLFGFGSGDELVQRLVAARPPSEVIDALVDARMLERYGDLSSPQAIARAADDAIYNDVRARLTAAEAAALERMARPTARVGTDSRGRSIWRGTLLPAARQYAKDVMARTKIRDIKPGQYKSAQTKAAKNAQAARNKGDLRKAAAEKRNQVIHQQLAGQAQAARDEVEKAIRYLGKFNRSGTRKNLDPEYVKQIDLLLDRFDLRARSNKDIDRSTSLASWIESQREANMEPDIDDYLQAEANRTHYKNLTLEQLRGLVDTVKQIEHLGRLKNKLLTDQRKRELAAVVAGLVDQVEQSAQSQGRQSRQRRTAQGLLDKLAQVSDFRLNFIRLRDLFRVLDNDVAGGPFWQTFMRPLNERVNWENSERAKASKELTAILTPLFDQPQDQLRGKWYPEIGMSLTRDGLFAIALNMGNDGNLQRLLDGYGWRVEQALSAISNLTPAELDAVQAVWDYIDQYWNQANEKHKRVYGVDMARVERREFTVRLADGTTKTLAGGYYPVRYDPQASGRADNLDEARKAENMMKGARIAATTRRTYSKQRADEVHGMPVLLNTSGLYDGLNEVLHDIALHEWVIDMNRLLNSKDLQGALSAYYGPEVERQIKRWVEDIAKGYVPSQDAMGRIFRQFRHNVSPALLGMSLRTILSMPTGLFQTVPVIGASWTMRGLMAFAQSPRKALQDASRMSGTIRNRARTRFRDLAEVRNRLSRTGTAKDRLTQASYAGMLWTQQFADTVTWHGAYLKAREENPGNEGLAIDLADQAVVDSQSGGDIKDLPRIMRTSELGKLFTAFSIYMGSSASLALSSQMSRGKAQFAADLIWVYAIQASAFGALMYALTPKGDDKWEPEDVAQMLVRENLSYLMGSFVGIRELFPVVDAVINKKAYDYSGPVGLKFIGDLQKLATQVGQGELDIGLYNATLDVVGDLTGIPSAQIKRTTQGARAIAEGKTQGPLEAAAALGFGYKR